MWLGTSALDLGAMSMFWYCFRERERILDLFEQSTGQRMHTRYFQVGGVIEDIPAGYEEKLREFIAIMPERVGQYRDLLYKNEIALQRLKGICPLERGGPARPRRHRPAAARRGQPVGPAQGRSVLLVRGLRLQDPGRHRGRQLGPHGRPHGRDGAVGPDHRAGARRAARGAVHHRGPQDRAAAAPRAGHLDGGAHPPLQARHRGLPRAAGRGTTSRSSRPAASWAASCAPTARPSPRACTCATPRS